MTGAALERFVENYAEHRAAEGRGYQGRDLFELPYLKTGPLAVQWAVRARTFDALMSRIVRPAAARLDRPLTLVDLGAGNGWLSYRLALDGHRAIAVDIRDDAVDGLAAAAPFRREIGDCIECLVAPFDAVPLDTASADIALFNASIHYATNLRAVLGEARRVTRPGGQIIILDSPFYHREADGLAMVSEKKGLAVQNFGDRAGALMAIPFIEFLTRDRLRKAAPDLAWRRHRVRYPIAYELRPLIAALRRKRPPSRFDLWVATRP